MIQFSESLFFIISEVLNNTHQLPLHRLLRKFVLPFQQAHSGLIRYFVKKNLLHSFVLIAAIVVSLQGWAQNLVPNGDFETYSSLPNSSGDWSFCTGWNNVNLSMSAWPYATPDYFHTSGTGGGKSPNTAFGDVLPQSGNAFIGLYSRHSSQLNSRDYMSTQLTSPLVVGQTYTISFWMTSGYDNYYYGSSCSHMGIQLSMTPLSQANHENTGGIPQAEVTTAPWIPSWTFYSFSYVATSAYQYVTIGNFYNDASTTTTLHDPTANYPSGAYYFIDNVVIETTTPLPVELIGFDAKNEGAEVLATWQTNVEINNDYFIVERSTDMENWTEIGWVDGAGTTSEQQSYSLYDRNPVGGVSYYRLSQTDFDGTVTHSDIRSVTRVNEDELHIYPVPAKEILVIEGAPTELESLSIYNAYGEKVMSQVSYLPSTGDNSVVLDISQLPAGMYLVHTYRGSQRITKL